MFDLPRGHADRDEGELLFVLPDPDRSAGGSSGRRERVVEFGTEGWWNEDRAVVVFG
jgi:hypothetical protein